MILDESPRWLSAGLTVDIVVAVGLSLATIGMLVATGEPVVVSLGINAMLSGSSVALYLEHSRPAWPYCMPFTAENPSHQAPILPLDSIPRAA